MKKFTLLFLILFAGAPLFAQNTQRQPAPGVDDCIKMVNELNPAAPQEQCGKLFETNKTYNRYQARLRAIGFISKTFDDFTPDEKIPENRASSVSNLTQRLMRVMEIAPFNKMDYVANGNTPIGFGPQVYKLKNWLLLYKKQYYTDKYDINASPLKSNAINEALLEFEPLRQTKQPCSNASIMMAMSNNVTQALGSSAGAAGADALAQTQSGWNEKPLSARNAMVQELLVQSMNNCDKRQFTNQIADSKAWGLLSPAYIGELTSLQQAAKGVDAQFEMGEGNSVREQSSNFYNNSADIEQRALRSPKPEEMLPADTSQITARLAETIPSKMAGTQTVNHIAEFYKTAPLNLKVDTVTGAYATYEPNSGAITINRDVINEYIKLSGKTYEQVMADPKELDRLADYVAPMFVHEATHQMQHARTNGGFAPYTTTSEIESSSIQAMYILERRGDAQFNNLFQTNQNYSSYAQNIVKSSESLEFDPQLFFREVESQYPDVLDEISATAHFLDLTNEQIENPVTRRQYIAPEIKEHIQAGNYSALTNDDFARYITSISKEELERLRADLMRYENSLTSQRKEMTDNVIAVTNEILGRTEKQTFPIPITVRPLP